MATGRGQLSSIELLPKEAELVVTWAAQELVKRDRTQVDIYAEFVTKCQQLMAEHRGELEFKIPAFSSFNRYSMKQARMTMRREQTRQIVKVLRDGHDPEASDDLAVITAESIKSQVFHMLGDMQDELVPKEVKELADAFKSAQAALNLSSARKAKEVAQLQSRLGEAVEAVAKVRGLTAETTETIKAEILGVVK